MIVDLALWGYKVAFRLPALQDNREIWQIFGQIIKDNKNVLNSPVMAHMLLNKNRLIYDNGQSGYWAMGLILNQQFPIVPNAKTKYVQYLSDIQSKIASRYFGVILTSADNFPYFKPSFLAQYYQYKETIRVPMLYNHYWDIDVWYPKPKL